MGNEWKDIEIGAEIDVQKIMEQIRERIAQKRKAGIYTEEGIAELCDARIMQYAEEAEIDSILLERLRSPDHSWNISPSYIITTHRSGIAAKTIVLLKKLVRPFVRLYTDHIIGRQAQINLYLAHLVHNLVREMTRMQISNDAVIARIERMDREREMLEHRVKTFEKMAVLHDQASDETK